MKKLFYLLAVAALVCISAGCEKKNYESVYEGIVTVKTLEPDQSCYFQLDPKTAMKPTNPEFKTNPFKKELRARILFYDRGQIEKPVGSPYEWKSAEVIALDTILTKKPVPAGVEYGTASIELVNCWLTCMEDGYLTLYFEGLWGNSGVPHVINLVETDDPLTFELKHDNKGDSELYRTRGLIAFDLRDLPVPQQGDYDVVVKYRGYYSDKTVKFHYKDGIYTYPATMNQAGLYE